MPPPQILKPTAHAKAPSPDDVTDFPAYKTIPIPESIPYREGKYRPASIPFISGTVLVSQATSLTTPICSRGRCTRGVRAG
jgi:hypothetical protein